VASSVCTSKREILSIDDVMRTNIEIDDELLRQAMRSTGACNKEAVVEAALLCSRLDQNCPQPIDTRAQSDLAAGRLDNAIHRALDDEQNGRVQPF
jgi:hypothetical protein